MQGNILIGEVGGSSSRWAFLATDGSTVLLPLKGDRIPGFNPVSGDPEVFMAAVEVQIKAACPHAMTADRVVIYGAGCGSAERRQRMEDAVRTRFKGMPIDVRSDLQGAALGLCGTRPGLVLILGTGMNAGYFDGTQLHQPMPSLGYVLGDEGSGADIGRCLLQDAFYQRIPDSTREALFGPQGPALGDVIEQVYRSSFPSRELASYTALVLPHRDHTYVHDLVISRFHAMAELLVTFFPSDQRAQVFATGSVAWGFKDWLAECLLDRGMTLLAAEQDPLPGLVAHHGR